MDTIEQMKLFIEPTTVALIGVSGKTEEDSFNILLNMERFGFEGRIYIINPFVSDVLGRKAYPDFKSVPEKIDLAVIANIPHLVPGLVKDCVEAGIKAIVIITQGFADADAKGKKLQEEILGIARAGGARIIGPNTAGIVNRSRNFCTLFVPVEKSSEKTSISFVMQTGLFTNGISPSTLAWKVFDIGNACDVDFADVLEYLEDDPETKLVCLHIEGLKQGRRLIDVARRVAKKKPILAIKTGRSEKGAKAVATHTGSMVGRDELYEAAFEQAGIIRINDVDELEDVSKALLYLPPMRGRRVAMATVTGGAGVIASDACELYGLEMAEFTESTNRKFAEMSPDWLSIGNPIDMLPACFLNGYQEAYGRSLRILLEDENVDAVVFFIHAIVPGKGNMLDISDLVEELAAEYKKPLIPWVYWGTRGYEMKTELEESRRTVTYPTLERTMRALAAQRKYLEFRDSAL